MDAHNGRAVTGVYALIVRSDGRIDAIDHPVGLAEIRAELGDVATGAPEEAADG